MSEIFISIIFQESANFNILDSIIIYFKKQSFAEVVSEFIDLCVHFNKYSKNNMEYMRYCVNFHDSNDNNGNITIINVFIGNTK